MEAAGFGKLGGLQDIQYGVVDVNRFVISTALLCSIVVIVIENMHSLCLLLYGSGYLFCKCAPNNVMLETRGREEFPPCIYMYFGKLAHFVKM